MDAAEGLEVEVEMEMDEMEVEADAADAAAAERGAATGVSAEQCGESMAAAAIDAEDAVCGAEDAVLEANERGLGESDEGGPADAVATGQCLAGVHAESGAELRQSYPNDALAQLLYAREQRMVADEETRARVRSEMADRMDLGIRINPALTGMYKR